MTTVKLYKTIFRFNLFNLPINHHKLIMDGVEATVIVYTMYCDIFESALLFTEYKKVWIKLI